MKNEHNNMKPRTVEGRIFRYHIRYEEGIYSEYVVRITQESTELGCRDELVLEPELINALTGANREPVDPPSPVAEIHNNRGFPTVFVHRGKDASLNPWTFEEDGMLLHFYRDGYSMEEIAKFSGHSADSVRERLRSFGLLDSDSINTMRAQVSGAVSLK